MITRSSNDGGTYSVENYGIPLSQINKQQQKQSRIRRNIRNATSSLFGINDSNNNGYASGQDQEKNIIFTKPDKNMTRPAHMDAWKEKFRIRRPRKNVDGMMDYGGESTGSLLQFYCMLAMTAVVTMVMTFTILTGQVARMGFQLETAGSNNNAIQGGNYDYSDQDTSGLRAAAMYKSPGFINATATTSSSSISLDDSIETTTNDNTTITVTDEEDANADENDTSVVVADTNDDDNNITTTTTAAADDEDRITATFEDNERDVTTVDLTSSTSSNTDDNTVVAATTPSNGNIDDYTTTIQTMAAGPNY